MEYRYIRKLTETKAKQIQDTNGTAIVTTCAHDRVTVRDYITNGKPGLGAFVHGDYVGGRALGESGQYVQCDICGEWVPDDEAITAIDRDNRHVTVCDWCDDGIEYCDYDGECYTADCWVRVYTLHGAERLPLPYIEGRTDEYFLCRECGEWHTIDYYSRKR